ncbi:MAG: hypothetical protein V9E93_16585 [Steroidobacteraceae bacterium]
MQADETDHPVEQARAGGGEHLEVGVGHLLGAGPGGEQRDPVGVHAGRGENDERRPDQVAHAAAEGPRR